MSYGHILQHVSSFDISIYLPRSIFDIQGVEWTGETSSVSCFHTSVNIIESRRNSKHASISIAGVRDWGATSVAVDVAVSMGSLVVPVHPIASPGVEAQSCFAWSLCQSVSHKLSWQRCLSSANAFRANSTSVLCGGPGASCSDCPGNMHGACPRIRVCVRGQWI